MVFEDYDNFDVKYEELSLDNGITLLVEKTEKEEIKIAKMISTDPQDYLRPELQPGSILKAVFY